MLLSLFVGFLLSVFGVGPEAVWQGIANLARAGARAVLDFLNWGMQYILIGAAVVLPIYLGRYLYRRFKSRDKP